MIDWKYLVYYIGVEKINRIHFVFTMFRHGIKHFVTKQLYDVLTTYMLKNTPLNHRMKAIFNPTIK